MMKEILRINVSSKLEYIKKLYNILTVNIK